MKEIRQIPILAIKPDPTQPRKNFDEEALFELAQSIKRNGLLQPITVRQADGEYIIVAGERRYKAVSSLGWETIECVVYTGDSAKELQLIENINRVDLNPMELAEAYTSYLDAGHTVDELSEVVGKPKNTISWLLNLTKCRPEIQHMVKHNQISLIVAIAQSKLTNDGQLQTLRIMHENKLSISECTTLCHKIEATESQADIFSIVPEQKIEKLTDTEVKARTKIQNAMERACQAMQEINNIEMDNPGISAQAIADKLDITQENIDLLYKLIGKFKSSLQNKRVAALC